MRQWYVRLVVIPPEGQTSAVVTREELEVLQAEVNALVMPQGLAARGFHFMLEVFDDPGLRGQRAISMGTEGDEPPPEGGGGDPPKPPIPPDNT